MATDCTRTRTVPCSESWTSDRYDGRGGSDRNGKEEQTGRLVEFNTKRFIASIERALLGRPNAIQTARSVAYRVLADLQGQERVHSSQLAVGVLDCLRRLDDIAYLRWATHIKQLPQVRNVKAEAIGLITHPSERLVFDQHASPVKRLAIHPTE